MTKPKPDKIIDLPVMLAFTDSANGESAIAELTRRLRDSESALTAHKERYEDAALKSDAALIEHQEEAEAFENASARISVALAHARKRLIEVQQTERQQAGAKARTEALALAEACGSLLRELLDQAKEITNKLARWNTRCAEVAHLNEIASAGGTELVAMPELPDDAEAAAEALSEAGPQLEKFLKDRSYEVYARKRRAVREAEAIEVEAKKRSEAPTHNEMVTLTAEGFDVGLFLREPRNPDERHRCIVMHQKLRELRKPPVTPNTNAAFTTEVWR